MLVKIRNQNIEKEDSLHWQQSEAWLHYYCRHSSSLSVCRETLKEKHARDAKSGLFMFSPTVWGWRTNIPHWIPSRLWTRVEKKWKRESDGVKSPPRKFIFSQWSTHENSILRDCAKNLKRSPNFLKLCKELLISERSGLLGYQGTVKDTGGAVLFSHLPLRDSVERHCENCSSWLRR